MAKVKKSKVKKLTKVQKTRIIMDKAKKYDELVPELRMLVGGGPSISAILDRMWGENQSPTNIDIIKRVSKLKLQKDTASEDLEKLRAEYVDLAKCIARK